MPGLPVTAASGAVQDVQCAEARWVAVVPCRPADSERAGAVALPAIHCEPRSGRVIWPRLCSSRGLLACTR